jgi:hypothetical protein
MFIYEAIDIENNNLLLHNQIIFDFKNNIYTYDKFKISSKSKLFNFFYLSEFNAILMCNDITEIIQTDPLLLLLNVLDKFVYKISNSDVEIYNLYNNYEYENNPRIFHLKTFNDEDIKKIATYLIKEYKIKFNNKDAITRYIKIKYSLL